MFNFNFYLVPQDISPFQNNLKRIKLSPLFPPQPASNNQ